MSVEVVTFGCRLNAWESDRAQARALADGLDDAVIFNTCAVTAEATRQARQAIRKTRRARPDARLIVTGCAAQIDPASFAAMAEVDAVIGNGFKTDVGVYTQASLATRVRWDAAARGAADTDASPPIDAQPVPRGARARAYVAVQTGCDHACTFCVIPQGRGASRSAPAGDVVAQVRALVAQGVAEVVLTGVDVTSWGADLPGRPSFGQLVGRILKLVPELARLRLSSIDAAEIDPDLLRLFAEEPRLMPHLHLSLQHGDDLILKRMKRRHSRAQAAALVESVRRVRPQTAFGADLIAGFPTESEAAFATLRTLVDELGLAYLHVFPFSARPGTPAARMPQLEPRVVKARAQILRGDGDRALARHLDAAVGRVATALVERPGVARAEDFTELAIASGGAADAPAGALMRGRIVAHDGRRAQAIAA